MGITTDNASNNLTFVNLMADWGIFQSISFDATKNYFWCFAHVINLSVQNTLSVLNNKISQVKFCYYICNFFFMIFNQLINLYIAPRTYYKNLIVTSANWKIKWNMYNTTNSSFKANFRCWNQVELNLWYGCQSNWIKTCKFISIMFINL